MVARDVDAVSRRLRWRAVVALVAVAAGLGCTDDDGTSSESGDPTSSTTPTLGRVEGNGETPVVSGEPIEITELEGRIVFDDYEDVYTMRPDGTDVQPVTRETGSEFDGAVSPDGELVVYRDSRRGINEDDEVYIAPADGTEARNLTNEPGQRLGAGLVERWPVDRLQLGPRRRRPGHLPGAPRRPRPDPPGDRCVGGVPDLLAGRHPDRVHGP